MIPLQNAGEPDPSISARIAKIALADYRAFPSGHSYELDLGSQGSNLLLFGENGSGKTSLFRALRDLMSLRPGPTNFDILRNIYTAGEDGFISVQLNAGAPNEFRWDFGNEHPRNTGGTPYALLADRFRFLDYKALLETNFVHRSNAPNLFSLLVLEVLKDLRVLSQGTEQTLGRLYERLLQLKPTDHHDTRRLEMVDEACQNFNDALANHLPEVVANGQRLLEKLLYRGMSFELTPTQVKYDRSTREFQGTEISLSVTLYTQKIDHPQLFLNEARLTALALALYLGAAMLVLRPISTSPDGTIVSRVLVFDDVLIGLDIANRLPVLRLLEDEFADWQIILMTYDRVWYDIAKGYTEHKGKWKYFKIRELEGATDRPGVPLIEPCKELLTIAETHLVNGDLWAAALYVREALEARLKSICENCGISVHYKRNPKDIKADSLWQGILDRQEKRIQEGQPPFIDQELARDIETIRSTILNRLSHDGAPNVATSEVEFALHAVRRLQSHTFSRGERQQPQTVIV